MFNKQTIFNLCLHRASSIFKYFIVQVMDNYIICRYN